MDLLSMDIFKCFTKFFCCCKSCTKVFTSVGGSIDQVIGDNETFNPIVQYLFAFTFKRLGPPKLQIMFSCIVFDLKCTQFTFSCSLVAPLFKWCCFYCTTFLPYFYESSLSKTAP